MAQQANKKRVTGSGISAPAPAPVKTTTNTASSSSTKTTKLKPKAAANKPQKRGDTSGKAAGAGTSKKRKAVEEAEEGEEGGDEGQSGGDKVAIDAGAPVLREILRVVKKSDFKRWPLANEKTQEDVKKILRAAEAPAVMSFRKEAAQAEAQHAVRAVVARLLVCVQRMPLPHVGKEVTLDYNDLVHRTTELEAVLAPTLRHNDDLEKELKLQTALLAKDEKELSLLQKNARDNERVRAEQLRVLPRAIRAEPQTPTYDGPEAIGVSAPPDVQAPSAYDPQKDRDLCSITAQLHQHLQSMETNTAVIGSIPEAIGYGRGAVRDVLSRGVPTLHSKAILDL
ncbi:CENP-Q, a CENPA-CAD centromere complex subunit-domain-containing protein [Tricharina praecox]|uniref:CENP-Q, a CENPA-CAD centromere complex subunit-domain-containing protein n=1 Tax=Tricharina praecox TaxID=43433 RepID=UPI0022212942|nr:CENP-Q, a CENPA-CAD centromere complex subunit-domain-containing protein [Tricharina praecox]KAI5855857.1 CENP-Q, a CENPA-CAD centromere complex subunit-domain-containing protein [Tricharina praecox]